MSIISDNQKEYAQSLTKIANVYEQLGNELIKIKVPSQIASSHLSLANDYILTAEAFRMIEQQSKDPVKSLLGVKTAKTAGEDQDQMLTNISRYFKSNGIIFNKTDVGNMWNSI